MALLANLRCFLRLPHLTVVRFAEGYPKEGATAVGFTLADDALWKAVLKRPTRLFRVACLRRVFAARNAPCPVMTVPVTCVLQAAGERKGQKRALSIRAAF